MVKQSHAHCFVVFAGLTLIRNGHRHGVFVERNVMAAMNFFIVFPFIVRVVLRKNWDKKADFQ